MPATSLSAPSGLNSPYGGTLIDLLVDEARAAEMKRDRQGLRQPVARRAGALRPGTPGHRRLLSPEGIPRPADYERVVAEMRLADGTLWPLPVTLPVTPGDGVAEGQAAGSARRLRQPAGLPPRRGDLRLRQGGRGAGRLRLDRRQAPVGRLPPAAAGPLRRRPAGSDAHARPITTSSSCGGRRPSCAAHFEDAGLDQGRRVPDPQPAAPRPRGTDQASGPADRRRSVDPPGRGRNQARRRRSLHARPLLPRLVDNYYEPGSVVLSLLPLAMRMAGPREVLLHAIIRRNHGCTHFIVGRDHAGPGNDSTGKPFYPPYAAQEAMARHQDEIGMEMVDFKQMVYLPDEDRYCPVDEVPAGARTADISGTQVRENYLAKGLQLPEWFSRPAVAEILNETNPPRFRQGVTIWFTGLSGSGKSTVAHALVERLAEFGRNVSLPGRRRDPDPPVEGPRLQQGGPRREHQPRRLRRRPGRPARRHHALLGHQPLPRAARQRPEVLQGELRRGLLRHPDRGLRAARRQGPLRQGPRRPDQGLHRRRRPVRAPAEPRGHARHQHALGPGVRRIGSSTSCSSWATSCLTVTSDEADPQLASIRRSTATRATRDHSRDVAARGLGPGHGCGGGDLPARLCR